MENKKTIHIDYELLAEKPANAEQLMSAITTAQSPAELVPPLKTLVEFKALVDERKKDFKEKVKQIENNFKTAEAFYDGGVSVAKEIALKDYREHSSVVNELDKKTGELMGITIYDRKIPAFVISKPANVLAYNDDDVLNSKALSKFVKTIKVVDKAELEKAILSGEITSKQLKSLRIIESDPRVSFYPGKL